MYVALDFTLPRSYDTPFTFNFFLVHIPLFPTAVYFSVASSLGSSYTPHKYY